MHCFSSWCSSGKFCLWSDSSNFCFLSFSLPSPSPLLKLPINLIFKLLSAIPEIASTTAREAIHITLKAFFVSFFFFSFDCIRCLPKKSCNRYFTIDLARAKSEASTYIVLTHDKLLRLCKEPRNLYLPITLHRWTPTSSTPLWETNKPSVKFNVL